MKGRSDNRKRLADLLGEVAVNEGMHRTPVEGVEVGRISKPVPRAPVVYQPKILIVGQDQCSAKLSEQVIRFVVEPRLVTELERGLQRLSDQLEKRLQPRQVLLEIRGELKQDRSAAVVEQAHAVRHPL